MLETHVFSKPITQSARKCPHKPASLSVIAGSGKGVVSFNSAVKPGTPVDPGGPVWQRKDHTDPRACACSAEEELSTLTETWEDKVTHICPKSSVHGPQSTLSPREPEHSVCSSPADAILHISTLAALPEQTPLPRSA